LLANVQNRASHAGQSDDRSQTRSSLDGRAWTGLVVHGYQDIGQENPAVLERYKSADSMRDEKRHFLRSSRDGLGN
jgi:hypothetical protein